MRKLAALICAGALACSALAAIGDINSVNITPRVFNDRPDSSLVINNAFPSSLTVFESAFGPGGYANRHTADFAVGGTNYQLSNAESFRIQADVYMDIGTVSPRKEAGFRFVTPNVGEMFFIFTSDGEVASFGGVLPFSSSNVPGFNLVDYTPGVWSTLDMWYRADIQRMRFGIDGNYTPWLSFGVPPNPGEPFGIPDLSTLGVYVQNAPSDPLNDFSDVRFGNFRFIPEPASLGLLALAGLLGMRRR
jgi:hypothetical protein